MTIKPLADKVVVKVEEAEQTTASGIVLTTSAQEKPSFATVVAVGPGGMVDGEKVEMTADELITEINEKCIGKPFRRLPLPKDISKRINFQ